MRCKYAHDMYCQVDIGLSCNMNMMKGIETLRLLSESILMSVDIQACQGIVDVLFYGCCCCCWS